MHVASASRPLHTQSPRQRLAVQGATVPTQCMARQSESNCKDNTCCKSHDTFKLRLEMGSLKFEK